MLFDLDTWRTIAIGSAALGQTCFAALYLLFFPWWNSFLGRALFYKAITLAVLTDLVFLARFFGFARNDELFVFLYLALSFGIWWQFSAFLRVYRRGKAYNGPQRRNTDIGGVL